MCVDLDEEATAILIRDRDAHSSSVEYGREFGILFQAGINLRHKREMSVGLNPDRSLRSGLFSRETNSRQTWLNGWLNGRTNGRTYRSRIVDDAVSSFRLSGAVFQDARWDGP